MSKALRALRAEEHVSVSSLNTYLRCPRQYEHRYILKTQKEHQSVALAFGSAIHEALAAYYSALRDNKPNLSIAELSDCFRDAWHQQLDREIPVLFGATETADSLIDRGISMIACFLEGVPRPYAVTDVEMPFSIELVNELTREALPNLVGVFDAVVQEEEGSYRILEHKTASRRWTKDKLDFEPQITAYHIAAPMLGLGEAEVTVQLLLKTKKPGFEIYTPIRSESDKRDFIEIAVGILQCVEAGAFYPRRDWHCHTCEFMSQCISG